MMRSAEYSLTVFGLEQLVHEEKHASVKCYSFLLILSRIGHHQGLGSWVAYTWKETNTTCLMMRLSARLAVLYTQKNMQQSKSYDVWPLLWSSPRMLGLKYYNFLTCLMMRSAEYSLRVFGLEQLVHEETCFSQMLQFLVLSRIGHHQGLRSWVACTRKETNTTCLMMRLSANCKD